jgi:endonuclease-3
MKAKKARLQEILGRLKQYYPDAHCALNFQHPYELLIATILSAQCTDERVNQVTEKLFRKYPRLEDYAQASLAELEADVKPTGFFRNKALAIQATAQQLLSEFGGEVPNSIPELTRLRGVGRKTASVVMGNAYGWAEGVVVDTHVKRLSQRLDLTRATTPEKIEQDLMRLLPQEEWVLFPHLLIFHGRQCCKARKPNCQACFLTDLCPATQR